MNKEEKNLLLIDISGRIPYNVKCEVKDNVRDGKKIVSSRTKVITASFSSSELSWFFYQGCLTSLRPYLRSLSKMTDKEKWECIGFSRIKSISNIHQLIDFNIPNPDFINWLNAHHFDYRDLIPKGLAIEAPDDMYVIE